MPSTSPQSLTGTHLASQNPRRQQQLAVLSPLDSIVTPRHGSQSASDTPAAAGSNSADRQQQWASASPGLFTSSKWRHSAHHRPSPGSFGVIAPPAAVEIGEPSYSPSSHHIRRSPHPVVNIPLGSFASVLSDGAGGNATPNATAYDRSSVTATEGTSVSALSTAVTNSHHKPNAVRVRWMTLLCYFANLALAACVSHYPILLTSISSEFHLTAEQAGRAGSFLYVGVIVSCGVFTPLASAFGEKIAMLLSLATCAVACMAEATSVGFETLCLAMFFLGLGCAGLEFMLSPLVAAMHRDNVTASLSMLHSVYPVGAIIFSLLVTLLQSLVGWRLVPAVVALLPIAAWVLFAREVFPAVVSQQAESTHPPNATAAGGTTAAGSAAGTTGGGGHHPNSGAGNTTADDAMSPASPSRDESAALAPAPEVPLKVLLRSPMFWMCVGLVTLYGAAEQGPSVWLPDFAQHGLGVSESRAGFSLTLYSLWMSLVRVGAGRFGSRWSPFWILAVSGTIQVVITGLVCFVLTTRDASASDSGDHSSTTATTAQQQFSYVFSTLIGCGVSLMWPTILSIAAMQHPNGGTKMYGMLSAVANLGDTFMAWIIGYIADVTKSTRLAFAASIVPALALIGMSFLGLQLVSAQRRRRRAQAVAETVMMADAAALPTHSQSAKPTAVVGHASSSVELGPIPNPNRNNSQRDAILVPSTPQSQPVYRSSLDPWPSTPPLGPLPNGSFNVNNNNNSFPSTMSMAAADPNVASPYTPSAGVWHRSTAGGTSTTAAAAYRAPRPATAYLAAVAAAGQQTQQKRSHSTGSRRRRAKNSDSDASEDGDAQTLSKRTSPAATMEPSPMSGALHRLGESPRHDTAQEQLPPMCYYR